MYDFAHPLSDYKEGITDSLCTLEFEVHRPLYMWVLENCDLENPLPEETEFARLNLDYTVMSKRKLKRLVEDGLVDGWDDPRMPTISGLRRRGFTPESIKDFCDRISVTKRDSVVSYLLLEECLRNDLNKRSNRLMCVLDPIKLSISNWDKGTEMVEVENNPEDESAGKRMIPFSGELWIEREDFSINPDKKYNRLKPGGEVIRIEIEKTIKDILTELVEDGLYTYRVFWTENDPYVWIAGSLKSGKNISRYSLNIEVVEPFKSQIISYLNSEGFKTTEDNLKYSGSIKEIRIRFR